MEGLTSGAAPAVTAAIPRRGLPKGSPTLWAILAGIVLVGLELAEEAGLVWQALNLVGLAVLYVTWGRLAGSVAARRTGWERAAWRWFAAAGWVMVALVVSYGLFVLTGLTDMLPDSAGADWGNREAPPMATYPLLILGFLHLARRGGKQNVVQRALDALLVAGGSFFVLWSSVFRDLFDASPLALDERIEVMSYPVMCSAVVVTAWLTLGRDGLARRSYRLAAMAATVPLGTDLADSILELGGDVRGALIGDIGFIASALLWVLAAVAGKSEEPWQASQQRASSKIETFLPIGVLVLAMGTALQTVNEHGAISPLQFWVAFGLIAALLLRTGLTLAENMRLERNLRDESAFKTRLLRFISHEVANPLSPLRVQVSLLRQTDAERTQAHERSWSIVDRSIERLLSLSTDVREMALAETQRLLSNIEVADAGAQVAAAAQSATPLAQQRGLELILHGSLEALPVRIDRQRFGQVLDNLLSNALKFTQKPGRITMRVEKRGDNVHVQVTDTGIGLSAADRDGMFQPFRRAQDGTTPGLGLGLYLCKAIMTELHGDIGVESPGRGQGATFWVSLPLEGSPESQHLALGPTRAAPARTLEAPSPTVTVKLS